MDLLGQLPKVVRVSSVTGGKLKHSGKIEFIDHRTDNIAPLPTHCLLSIGKIPTCGMGVAALDDRLEADQLMNDIAAKTPNASLVQFDGFLLEASPLVLHLAYQETRRSRHYGSAYVT